MSSIWNPCIFKASNLTIVSLYSTVIVCIAFGILYLSVGISLITPMVPASKKLIYSHTVHMAAIHTVRTELLSQPIRAWRISRPVMTAIYWTHSIPFIEYRALLGYPESDMIPKLFSGMVLLRQALLQACANVVAYMSAHWATHK